jgi:hypothetical protein
LLAREEDDDMIHTSASSTKASTLMLDAAAAIDEIAAELAALHDDWRATGAPGPATDWLAGVLHRLGYWNARLTDGGHAAHA